MYYVYISLWYAIYAPRVYMYILYIYVHHIHRNIRTNIHTHTYSSICIFSVTKHAKDNSHWLSLTIVLYTSHDISVTPSKYTCTYTGIYVYFVPYFRPYLNRIVIFDRLTFCIYLFN